MSEVTVVEDDIVIKFTLEEAQILKTVIGRFNPEFAGPFKNLWDELEDAGVQVISNLFLATLSKEPELQLFIEEPEDVQHIQEVPGTSESSS